MAIHVRLWTKEVVFSDNKIAVQLADTVQNDTELAVKISSCQSTTRQLSRLCETNLGLPTVSPAKTYGLSSMVRSCSELFGMFLSRTEQQVEWSVQVYQTTLNYRIGGHLFPNNSH